MVSLFNELAYHIAPNSFLSMLAVRRNRRTCHILSNLNVSTSNFWNLNSNIDDGIVELGVRDLCR